jgi:hypothetical protein
MRRVIACVGALILLAPLSAQADEIDAAAGDMLRRVREANELLKSIRTKADAVAARPKLAALGHPKEDFESRLPPKRLTDAQRRQLQDKYGAEIEAASVEFKQQIDRLEKSPEVMAVLAEAGPIEDYDKTRRLKAWRDAESLAQASELYRLRNGGRPEKLTHLLQPPDGGRPYLDKPLLTDPWGRPYQYDVAGTHNGGSRPDIWSLGPPYAADPKKAIIGNWEKSPKP